MNESLLLSPSSPLSDSLTSRANSDQANIFIIHCFESMLLLTLSTTIENTVEPHTPLCISSSTIVVFAVLSQSSSTIAPQLGDEYCDPRFKVDQVANHQNFGIHHKCCGGRCFFKREWLSTVQYYDLNKSEHIIQAGVIPLVILSRQLNYVTVGI